MALVLPVTNVEKKFSPSSFNRSTEDGPDIFVQLAADHRKHVWANNTAIKRGRSTRACGMAPLGASHHTLLAIALIGSLRSVNKGIARRVIGFNSTRLPAVHILVNDEAFAAAVRAFAAGKATSKFRAGRNFWHHMQKQLRRFKVTVEVVPADDGRLGSLRDWAVSAIYDSRNADDIPPVFQPAAVSMAA